MIENNPDRSAESVGVLMIGCMYKADSIYK